MEATVTLKAAKAAIRQFVRQHWTDEKLASVFAFNADGRMKFTDSCGCLLGVTLLSPHTFEHHNCPANGDQDHYVRARRLNGGILAEEGYGRLMDSADDNCVADDGLASRRLSAILKGEMKIRARLRETERQDRHIALLKAAAPGVCNMDDGDLEALEAVLRG